MFGVRVSIILLFIIFVNILFFSYAGELPIPNSEQTEPSNPNLMKGLTFGRLNTIASGFILVLTLLNIIVYKLRELQEANLTEELNSPSSCRRFTLSEILSATNHFSDELVLGRGGFGKVYKGFIDDGTVIVAIKRLNKMSKQGSREFRNEIEMLSKIRHCHIVSLIGYCNIGKEMIIVYDYMVNGTMSDQLHKKCSDSTRNTALSWVQRLKICIGAAHGLNYLHTGTGATDRVIHRDVKSSNILLDEYWGAKISDFGMSKIGPANSSVSHISTNVKGTFGYLDPEYVLTSQLTRKSDVYSFGVVLFEMLCGRPVIDLKLELEQRGLAGWAQQNVKQGTLDQIIDPSLSGQILPDSLKEFAKIADQSVNMFSQNRPTMAEVVVSLELALKFQERVDDFFIESQENPSCTTDEQLIESQDKPSSTTDQQLIERQENPSSTTDQQLVESQENSSSTTDEQLAIVQQADSTRRNEHHSASKPIKTREFPRKVLRSFAGLAKLITGKSQKASVDVVNSLPEKSKQFDANEKGESSLSRDEKLKKIFEYFDANRDGGLGKEEMEALVAAVNPRVKFSDRQMKAIIAEVFRTYGDYIDEGKGLTFTGFLKSYDDGAGDPDRDYEALGFGL